MSKEIQLQSVIICPNCGYKKEEMISVDACQYLYMYLLANAMDQLKEWYDQ